MFFPLPRPPKAPLLAIAFGQNVLTNVLTIDLERGWVGKIPL